MIINQKPLSQAVSILGGLTSKSRNTIPVLGEIHVSSKDGVAEFSATDMESWVQVTSDVTCEGPEVFMLPASTVSSAVSLLPSNASIDLSDAAGHVLLKTDEVEYNLLSLPAVDYPIWETETPTLRFELVGSVFSELLGMILYALPKKDFRMVLTGICFDIAGAELKMTATDGKKMSLVKHTVPNMNITEPVRFVVAGKLLTDLNRSIDSKEAIVIEVGSKQVSFRSGNVLYRTRLLEGKYPDINAVIPKSFKTTVTVDRNEFLRSVKRAGVMSGDTNKSILLYFKDGECEFTSTAADVGKFDGALPAVVDGEAIEMGFNFRILSETINSFQSPNLTFKIASQQAPVMVSGELESNRMSIVMPIKLSELRAQQKDEK
jgi:DNA polymerase III subunit beta